MMDDTQLSEIVEVILRNPKNLATKIELNEQAKVALKLFVENDSDYNNFLGFEELKKICDFMGLPVEEDEEEALNKIDTDQSGSLSIIEWISWWLKRISNYPNPLKQQEAIAFNTFRKFDRDHSGYLDAEEFQNLLSALGADISPTELLDALGELDEDGNGKIASSEFVSWWTHRASNNRRNSSIVSLKMKKLASKAAQIFYTDIFTAAWKGDEELTKSLLVGVQSLALATDSSDFGDGLTALHYACYQGHTNIAEILLDGGAKVNAISTLGLTPLFYAAQRGHHELCSLLLQRNADPTIGGSDPTVDAATYLCPVDFSVDYPLIRQLFADHPRCKAPMKLPLYTIQVALNLNGVLSVKFNIAARDYQSVISVLPLRKWEVMLAIATSKSDQTDKIDLETKSHAEDDDYGNDEFEQPEENKPSQQQRHVKTATLTFPASPPSSLQAFDFPIEKSWLMEAGPGDLTLKIAGIHALGKGPFSDEVAIDTAEYVKSIKKPRHPLLMPRIPAVKTTPLLSNIPAATAAANTPSPAASIREVTARSSSPGTATSTPTSALSAKEAKELPLSAAEAAALAATAAAKRKDDARPKSASRTRPSTKK